MRPVGYGNPRAFTPPTEENAAAQEQENDLTRSYTDSDSEEDAWHDPAPQQLARAILIWDPALVSSLCAAGMRQEHAPAFAGFLSRLNLEARPQTALRTEVLAWLHTLCADASKLQNVFRIAAESWENEAVLLTYRAMRAASE